MAELVRIAPSDLFVLKVERGVIHGYTWITLLLVASLISAGWLARTRRLRLGSAIMFAAGVVLLTHGTRFVPEFALLCLPLLRDAIVAVASPPLLSPRFATALALAASLPALVFLHAQFGRRPAWPIARTTLLAEGTARFIETSGIQGRLLTEPGGAGYFEWREPQVKTAMDFQIPFAFVEDDYFLTAAAFRNPEALRRMVVGYRPDFIAVPVGWEFFRPLIARFPAYAPVFFDDIAVLYADVERHPEIARYRLEAIDPWAIAISDVSSLREEKLTAIAAELGPILEIDPQSGAGNLVAARVKLRLGDASGALAHADAARRTLPQSPFACEARGDALFRLGRTADAQASYREALACGIDDEHRIDRKLWVSSRKLAHYDEAYEEALASLNGFPIGAGYVELFQLAVSANEAGKKSESEMFLRYALLQVPPEEAAWREKIETALGRPAEK